MGIYSRIPQNNRYQVVRGDQPNRYYSKPEIDAKLAVKVSSVTATAPITSSGGITPNISTSIATSRLVGRTTAGTGVMEQISVGSTLSLSALTLALNLANNNTWTGLQTFSRAGSNDLLIGQGSVAAVNKTSGTYGQILFQSSGFDRAAINWDSNGALYYLASQFFSHRFRIGTDEMFVVSSSGAIVNGQGNGNNFTLDVRGTFGVTDWDLYGVPYITDGLGHAETNTANLTYTNERYFGVNKSSPTASEHVGIITRTIADVTNLTGGAGPNQNGYTFGTGDQNYSVWAFRNVDGTNIYSSNPATILVEEPTQSDFDPTGGGASEQSGSGYDTTIDPPPSYEIYARYDSGNARSIGSVNPSVGSWSGSNPTADVFVNWNQPINGQPYDYIVVRNATDYQIINSSNTFFVDQNTGWTGSPPSPSNIKWYVSLQWDATTGAVDYVVFNTTNTTYTNPGTNSVSDFNSGWIGATPTTTPTSADEKCFIAEGTVELMKSGTAYKLGTFGGTPVFQQSGSILTGLANYNLFTSPTISASEISAGATLSRTNDTNVTLTLGGSPNNALLAATSLTLGWTGTLAQSRGGTGASSYGANRIVFQNSGNTAFTSNANFVFDGTNFGLGASTPLFKSDVRGTSSAQGNFKSSSSTKTTAYTATTADNMIPCDATSAGFTVTLPALSSAYNSTTGTGLELCILKIDSTGNVVTVDGSGSETINGQTTQSLDVQWESMIIQATSGGWFIKSVN